MIKATTAQVRRFRLRAHHLDRPYPSDRLIEAAGVCGFQNSPPGAWESAAFNRLEGCSADQLRAALYDRKELLQAWSYRGVPVVFPAAECEAFLAALIPEPGEPWIYTQGIGLALDFLCMEFDELLPLVRDAASCLDNETVESKESLDKRLAAIVGERLPKEKRALWTAPSMYGKAERHIVGEAVVSFMLRPCSLMSLVVFGRRSGISPTFTSLRSWLGEEHDAGPDVSADVGASADSGVTADAGAGKRLVRKFLHCYGPATPAGLMTWLGCSKQQARRLWDAAAEETVPVEVEGKERHILDSDRESLLSAVAPAKGAGQRLLLLSAHDPYLDQRDREVILEDKARHREVWRTVANPGAVLKDGRIIGIWKAKARKGQLDLSISPWEAITTQEQQLLGSLAEGFAAFKGLHVSTCTIA